MMKKNTLKKIIYIFLLVLVMANIAVWITDTTYIYKALIYQQPNIDDLELFDYTTITNTEKKEAWNISENKNKTELSDTLNNMLTKYESVAFLVIKNDSIQHEQYWDGYSDSSFSNSFSMSKSIVSILVGIAIDEGKIESENDPIGKYIPEFNQGDLQKIKIIDVLKMASGLDFKESYSTPFNQTTDAYYGKDLRKLIYSLKAEKPSGKEFYYRSGDTQILSFLVKAATGKSVSEYAAEKLWSKIGAEQVAHWSLDRKGGDEKAYCCFYSNARDFARIGKLYLQNGKWDDQQVVSEQWVKKSITPHSLPQVDGKISDQYGLQWWIYKDVFYCRGILGQYIVIIPSENMIIVRLGKKRTDKAGDDHPIDVKTYIEECRKLF